MKYPVGYPKGQVFHLKPTWTGIQHKPQVPLLARVHKRLPGTASGRMIITP